MKLHLKSEITKDFSESVSREWIDTNGLGGWASGTICGALTRRYHGLLVAAQSPPRGRVVLVSKFDEAIVCGTSRTELGCNQYPGAVAPQGFLRLREYLQDPFPTFVFDTEGFTISKRIVALHGENTTIVEYVVENAPSPFILEIRPFLAGRDYHSLVRAEGAPFKTLSFDGATLTAEFPGEFTPALPKLYISLYSPSTASMNATQGTFHEHPDWYYHFEYLTERMRGYDYLEDLRTPGIFAFTCGAGSKITLRLSTSPPATEHADALVSAEARRRSAILPAARSRDEFLSTLFRAADQFLVRRGEARTTIIAGYHWFTDWGRDTMISLPGLCLVTGRFKEARDILATFAAQMSEGMIPNNFHDANGEPEFNTVDGSLWFVVACYQYFRYTQDLATVRDLLLPRVEEVIERYTTGTRFDIKVAEDHLLSAGNPTVQLTWMDAKIGKWVVTPRHGKAVEINALWYNALCIAAQLHAALGNTPAHATLTARAEQVAKAFLPLFWNEAKGALFDCVSGDVRDGAIRPNQLFALSLPFPLLAPKEARRVLDIVRRKLLTSRGLRSLDPSDREYHGSYRGKPEERDAAYHQGTVWSFLLGPYITSTIRFCGDEGMREAREIISACERHLTEGAIGTISEIFDGDAPHHPKGCIAQAWSVGEILRAYIEDIKGSEKKG